MASKICFTVNGTPVTVPSDVRADTRLVTFIRNHVGLKGTKYMCKEGACGSCIVTLTRRHPVTKEDVTVAINSCLTPVLACHGGSVTTIEGIGDRETGYSNVQASLAAFSGSQCGFCSPGMVMNMHSLLSSKKTVNMKDVENSFGGNFCRCTGYRPILDAFKSLSADANGELKRYSSDIEDLWKICDKGLNGGKCKKNCSPPERKIMLPAENKCLSPQWIIVESVEELLDALDAVGRNSYILVAGNTALGVYKPPESPSVYININHIRSLKEYTVSKDRLVLGANMTLTETMELFYKLSGQKNFGHLKVLADHINLVANVPVRNVGTLAGNLMIKHAHPEFPSDIFVMLETVNATIVIVSNKTEDGPIPIMELLKKKMNKAIITKIIIPSMPREYRVRSFKIMQRAQNVFAYVNAGFSFKLDKKCCVTEKPNIVYGGISSKFVHASETEDYLDGKILLDNEVFKKAISILSNEINPMTEGFQASAEYRKKLALNLFYKYVIGIEPEKISPLYRSGGTILERPLSRGVQTYEVKKDSLPLYSPIKKLEAMIQCSGEAEYVNDIPESKGQLYAALVLAEQANATIADIDASTALNREGVVAFFTAKDIPGKNVFSTKKYLVTEDEELFCSGRVRYGGQPVGIIVAETEDLAQSAANEVNISYKDGGDPPALTVHDLWKQDKSSRITNFATINAENLVKNGHTKTEIHGEVTWGAQYHFTIEPQSCVCVPMEDGLNVYSATQWIANVQSAVSAALKIPENSINMEVRRLGGGFGCKITRCSMIATACALAAVKLNKPVKIVLDIETNMKAVGKRNSSYSKYQVGVDESGVIQWLRVWLYDERGCSLNDPGIMLVESGIRNCYESSNWEINLYEAVTDAPGSAWMRAPGTLEGISTIEEIMEHIAFVLRKDPLEIRIKNMKDKFPLMTKMVNSSVNTSCYHERRRNIEQFNEANRWKKRGISFLPMAFHLEYFFTLNSMVSIFGEDGTVSITHGGVEMGQGVNTKAAQICAATLGIDINKIKVKPTSALTSPNAALSGASITSDCVAYSTKKCCEILNERLKEVKEKMKGATWEEIIFEAYENHINLNASFLDKYTESELTNYYVYATAVTEVEVDILTGQHQILRTDILEDAGDSLNPQIDVGQIEGGFVMGLGYFLTERIQLDPVTGVTYTNNTAKYCVPGAKDIPIDFRVSLLKDAPNPVGVARSKATGEPAVCLALSAVFALRNAVLAARKEAGQNDWLPSCQPFSVEKVCLAAKTEVENLSL